MMKAFDFIFPGALSTASVSGFMKHTFTRLKQSEHSRKIINGVIDNILLLH